MSLAAVVWWFSVVLASAPSERAGLEQTDVFVSGRDGYHTFRIPAVVASTKGTLLAFCEGRKNSRSDTGDIDVVLRRSFDLGKTWRPLELVADEATNTIGNPCPVVDRETGTIWLLLTRNHGQDRQQEIEAGTSREPRTVWACHSRDDGATWTKPSEISRTTRQPDWGWYGTGPCNGVQLRSGRLLIPCHHTPPRSHDQHAHVIFSDDHGLTWQLGGVAGPNAGECTIAELPDGSLLMNIRTHPRVQGRRGIAVSRDAGLTWSKMTLDPLLVDPGCQGSLLRITASSPADKDRLLFANPASSRREKLTVRLSHDEGQTWPVSRILHEGPASYCCLTALPDTSVGCLFECGTKSPVEKIVFVRFAITWLTP
jgi:sialidase-1